MFILQTINGGVFMKTFVFDIPDHNNFDGIEIFGEDGGHYELNIEDENCIILKANKNGLISIAKQMLYMAYNNFPEGGSVHFDSFFTKIENMKIELILAKEKE